MNKAKVYKGVACLEIASSYGGKWWYQTGNLSYTPVLIKEISIISVGKIKKGGREVLATPLNINGKEHLVVLNLPRTDILGLKSKGIWPKGFSAPHETCNYNSWPKYTNNNYKFISLA